MTRPFILITNDDGIGALGIRYLFDAVRDFADVVIVAPHTEKSGSGLAATWSKPLHIREAPWEGGSAWSINGTPADCVKMTLSVLFPDRRPAMILSGINRGSNAGRTVLYSGTVGGIMEGTLRGINGIAFSFTDFEFPEAGTVKAHIAAIVKHFLHHDIPKGTLLNVTFPGNKVEIKGFRMARQGRGYWMENPDRRLHPSEGAPYYWLGGKWAEHEEHEESDVRLAKEGYIAIAPIQISELTNLHVIEQHRDAIKGLFL